MIAPPKRCSFCEGSSSRSWASTARAADLATSQKPRRRKDPRGRDADALGCGGWTIVLRPGAGERELARAPDGCHFVKAEGDCSGSLEVWGHWSSDPIPSAAFDLRESQRTVVGIALATVLTPPAVALDIVTLPFQLVVTFALGGYWPGLNDGYGCDHELAEDEAERGHAERPR